MTPRINRWRPEEDSHADLTIVELNAQQVDAIMAYNRRKVWGGFVGGVVVTGIAAYLFWNFYLKDGAPLWPAGDGSLPSASLQFKVVGETVHWTTLQGEVASGSPADLPIPAATPGTLAHVDTQQGAHGVVESLIARLQELGYTVTLDTEAHSQ